MKLIIVYFRNTAPQQSNSENVLASVYNASEIPLLENRLELLNEKQARRYIVPQIIRDICERTGKLVSKVKWGDASFEPSFWANDLAPWSQVTNIAHPQKTKFGTCTSEILKEGIQ